MTNKLNELLSQKETQRMAMNVGTAIHSHLGRVFFNPDGTAVGDADLVVRIAKIPELVELMGHNSKAEVPIAGVVNGRFISRRIDRLYVNNATKTVVILDYKSDTDKKMFYKKYREQLNEYRELLKQIYRHFNISCKILWTNDFTLENLD